MTSKARKISPSVLKQVVAVFDNGNTLILYFVLGKEKKN